MEDKLRKQIESLVREAAADQVAVCPDLIDARAYAEKIIAIVRTAIEPEAKE